MNDMGLTIEQMKNVEWTVEQYKNYARWRRTGYRNCKNCGKNYLFSSGQHDIESSKFCSRECAKIDASKRAKEYMYKHPEISKRLRDAVKLRVLVHYSGDVPKCACCEDSRYEFLCVDHIAGGGSGNKQYIELRKNGTNFYRWIINNNFPEGLQVLCYNCNRAKGNSKVQFCPVHHSELYKKS